MPTFELSANGKTFEIDAPDQAAAVDAFQKMNGTAAPAGPQFNLSDAVTDIPAEIGRTAQANIDTIKEGVTNRGSKGPIEGLMSTGKAMLAVPGLIASPITGAARSLIGHPVAQLTHKVGEAIAPEIAAKDDPQKMYEAAAGDVEKSLLAAKPAVRAPPKVAAPTVAELKDASRAGYRSPEVAAVDIKPQSTANLAAKIENDLVKEGYRNRPSSPEKSVFDEVRALEPPSGVTSVKVSDLHSAQKALGIMARERDAIGAPTPKAAAASVAKQHLDDYLPSIAPADVLAGDAVRASEILGDAGKNWGAAKRGEAIDLQMTRAERQAAKSGAGSNIENSMRQKIATLLDNPKRTVGFTDAEKAAMESIVRGTPTRNAMRKAGKLGVDGGLSLAWNTAAAMGTGGATLPVTVGSTLARKLGERLTSKEGRALSEMVRSRSPLARGNVGTTAVARALTKQTPKARATVPYAAIISALMQPQRQGAHSYAP